jgi:crotonobetainyl-CoA:carnitine CoA-transferase CaiB-like acyl-CoA transferase
MKQILEGIKVVDWSGLQVGPYAAAMLADMGADVIHVEDPKRGDIIRGIETLYGIRLVTPEGRHVLFEEHNRNKRGLAVDLKKDKGKEVVYNLVKSADVFLTNFRTQAVTKMGMDYETLKDINPRIVYAHASGFGLKGPDADSPSIDLIAQAKSGMMMASGEEGGPPVFLTLGIGDRLTSFVLAYGVIAALLARERYGFGQKVETSQLASNALIQGNSLMPTLLLDAPIPRHSHKYPPRNPIYNYFRCKDDRWIVLASWQERYWPTFCKGLGMPELEKDPKFDSMEKRMENRRELVEILDEVFMKRDSGEWYNAFKAAGDLLFTVANTIKDLTVDPQMISNDYIVTWDHPVLGKIKWPGFFVQFSETPQNKREPAPEIGQHTEEILLGLGYNWEQIVQLKDEMVI